MKFQTQLVVSSQKSPHVASQDYDAIGEQYCSEILAQLALYTFLIVAAQIVFYLVQRT